MSVPSLRDLDGHNPYELLGISPTATRAEIVAAHRRQVQLVHPDRPNGDEYETKLLHIAKAVLLDPQRRNEFDAARSRPVDDDPLGEWEKEELLNPAGSDTSSGEAGSVWESEEVVTGASSPPWVHVPPPPNTTAYLPPYPTPLPPMAWPPPPIPARSSVSALPVVALVLSATCCSPVGLVLGLISLANPKGRSDRGLAIAAIVVGSVWTLWILVWILRGSSSQY